MPADELSLNIFVQYLFLLSMRITEVFQNGVYVSVYCLIIGRICLIFGRDCLIFGRDCLIFGQDCLIHMDIFGSLGYFYTFLPTSDILPVLVAFGILGGFAHFAHFWQFMVFFGNFHVFWQFLPFLAIETFLEILGNFCNIFLCVDILPFLEFGVVLPILRIIGNLCFFFGNF